MYQRMRTTITLDDDVFEAARAQAQASGKNLGEFGWAHALACPSENEVYVGELLNWRVQKLVVKGSRPAATRSGAAASRLRH